MMPTEAEKSSSAFFLPASPLSLVMRPLRTPSSRSLFRSVRVCMADLPTRVSFVVLRRFFSASSFSGTVRDLFSRIFLSSFSNLWTGDMNAVSRSLRIPSAKLLSRPISAIFWSNVCLTPSAAIFACS